MRVPDTQYHLISRPLDAGALGLMIPRVETGAPFEEEEPPPLRVPATDPNEPILYNAPPQVTDADRIAFERLQAAGIVAAHLTPELMASSSRDDVKDGVGEELANGHVQGSVAPAGHPDDPYKRKRWRQKQSDIRDEVAGILSN